MNSLAPGYDFFTYFFTLVLTPMLLLSGVYFPVDQMPAWLAGIADVLPLKHAIDVARPLMQGRVPDGHRAARRGARAVRGRRRSTPRWC